MSDLLNRYIMFHKHLRYELENLRENADPDNKYHDEKLFWKAAFLKSMDEACTSCTELDRFIRTGEVAKMLGVSPRKASTLIDSGQFEGSYRLPTLSGAPGDRRVPLRSVVKFIEDMGG